MRDFFGADAPATEGTPIPPASAAPAAAAAAVAAQVAATPTVQQVVNKAVAKSEADAKVATDPHVTHSTKTAPLAPKVLGSTAAGALIGSAILPGPGTAIGAAAGWLAERYNIGGGPFGKLIDKVKPTFTKATGIGAK